MGIDLSKDPYFLRNHLGSYECKLCLTLHTNEGSYLAHTQGKKHQINLARRAAKEKQDATIAPQPQTSSGPRKTVKIGRPGYCVTKERDPDTQQKALLFEIEYPEALDKIKPRHRFMSAFEQKVEPPDMITSTCFLLATRTKPLASRCQIWKSTKMEISFIRIGTSPGRCSQCRSSSRTGNFRSCQRCHKGADRHSLLSTEVVASHDEWRCRWLAVFCVLLVAFLFLGLVLQKC